MLDGVHSAYRVWLDGYVSGLANAISYPPKLGSRSVWEVSRLIISVVLPLSSQIWTLSAEVFSSRRTGPVRGVFPGPMNERASAELNRKMIVRERMRHPMNL